MSAPKRVKHSLIVCHPAQRSFTMSIARRYADTAEALGHEVEFRDLYRINFDPVLKDSERPAPYRHHISDDVAQETSRLEGTDVLVLVYPLWFGSPPAMMKGYIERVLGCDFSYENIQHSKPHPLFSEKLLVSFTTSGTSTAWLQERGVLNSLRTLLDDYLQHAFSFADRLHFHFDRIPDGMAPRFGDEILSQVELHAREVCSRLARADPQA
jgi:NAD(P)H dehydrogenase (quinone)